MRRERGPGVRAPAAAARRRARHAGDNYGTFLGLARRPRAGPPRAARGTALASSAQVLFAALSYSVQVGLAAAAAAAAGPGRRRAAVVAASAYPAVAGTALWALLAFHGYLCAVGSTTKEFLARRRAAAAARRRAAAPPRDAPASPPAYAAVPGAPPGAVDVGDVELAPAAAAPRRAARVPDAGAALASAGAARAALRAVLASRGLLALLRADLDAALAAEPLAFFEAVAGYRARPTRDAAAAVFAAFVAPGAPDAVDVSGRARRDVARRLAAGGAADGALFDAAVDSALASLARTRLRPFLDARRGAAVDDGDGAPPPLAVSGTLVLAL